MVFSLVNWQTTTTMFWPWKCYFFLFKIASKRRIPAFEFFWFMTWCDEKKALSKHFTTRLFARQAIFNKKNISQDETHKKTIKKSIRKSFLKLTQATKKITLWKKLRFQLQNKKNFSLKTININTEGEKLWNRRGNYFRTTFNDFQQLKITFLNG